MRAEGPTRWARRAVGTSQQQEPARCRHCGRPRTLITIRKRPVLTMASCSMCQRRWWTVDGADASIADVLAILEFEPGLRAGAQPATSLARRGLESGRHGGLDEERALRAAPSRGLAPRLRG